jgi:amino acid transporter
MTIRLIFMLFAAFSFAIPAMAVIEKTSTSAIVIAQQTNQLKKDFKMEKQQEMAQKNLKKSGFKNPVNRWLWFGLTSLILGGLSYFIALLGGHNNSPIYALLGRLSLVFAAIGVVLLIIWLVKKIA